MKKERNVDEVRKTSYDELWHIVQNNNYCRVDRKTALRVSKTMYYDKHEEFIKERDKNLRKGI